MSTDVVRSCGGYTALLSIRLTKCNLSFWETRISHVSESILHCGQQRWYVAVPTSMPLLGDFVPLPLWLTPLKNAR